MITLNYGDILNEFNQTIGLKNKVMYDSDFWHFNINYEVSANVEISTMDSKYFLNISLDEKPYYKGSFQEEVDLKITLQNELKLLKESAKLKKAF